MTSLLRKLKKTGKIQIMKIKLNVLLVTFFLYYSTLPLSCMPVKPFHFYQHNRWTMLDGLPMDSALAIAQTPDGYIWIGTERGVARFDGITFEEVHGEAIPPEINVIVLTLFVDRAGVLWIGTRGEGLIRYKNGKMIKYDVKDGLSGNEIWSIAESEDGILWVGTINGLNFIQEGKISRLTLPEILHSHKIRSLTVDKQGWLWVGTTNGLALVKKRVQRFDVEYKNLDGHYITTIFEDKIGNIWLGTKSSGLARQQEQKFEFYTTKNGLPVNNIRCLYEDRSGNLWIGTKGGGICICDTARMLFYPVDDPGDLECKWIYTFFEDREKTLWFGSQGGGLNSLRDTPIITYTTKNGFSSNLLYGVFQDSQGYIWVGSKGLGLNRLDPRNNRTRIFTTRDGLSSNSVVSFAETPGGFLWLGSLGGGINRYRLSDGQIKTFTEKDGLTDLFVRVLYCDTKGRLWAGTDSGALYFYENHRFHLYKTLTHRVNIIYKDKNENLWVGTFGGGLFRIHHDTIEVFDKFNGLSGNYVSYIHQDKSGAMWIATTGQGVTRYHNGQFHFLTKRNGLPDNAIHVILEDSSYHLWMSSNRGIFFLDRHDAELLEQDETQHFQFFCLGIEDGMKSLECNGSTQPSGIKDHDGRLWFPTTRGLSMVNPGNLQVNLPPPPVKIESIHFDQQTRPIYKPSPVIIPPGNRNLEIKYTALSFIASKKIQFRCKLEGWEDDWVETGTRRFAVYSNIPPGKYRFVVTACNREGTWNRNSASLNLYIEARFYETALFKYFFPIILALIIYFSYTTIRKYQAAQRLQRKYQKTSTTPQESRECLDIILHHIKSKKLFQSPDISLNSLAELLEINPRKISLAFNEYLHKNFYEVINNFRVEEAKQMLLESPEEGKSILDICYEVGFNHKSSFNRVFKSITGMTPSEFRKKNGNKYENITPVKPNPPRG